MQGGRLEDTIVCEEVLINFHIHSHHKLSCSWTGQSGGVPAHAVLQQTSLSPDSSLTSSVPHCSAGKSSKDLSLAS